MSDQLNSRARVFSERIATLREGLESAAKGGRWDRCLRLEGQIEAYESVWATLLRWGLLTDDEPDHGIAVKEGRRWSDGAKRAGA